MLLIISEFSIIDAHSEIIANIKYTINSPSNNPYIILAQISVPISTSTITNSLITDLRQFSKIDSNKLELDIASSFVAGFKQADSNETETRLVVTEPNDATPTAIEGVQLIWLKKKA